MEATPQTRADRVMVQLAKAITRRSVMLNNAEDIRTLVVHVNFDKLSGTIRDVMLDFRCNDEVR